uniref:MFS transporter n=1 Tax=Cyberlindnera americana TaxID=36016 RepID=A0A5P8N8P6_9ASCO|nr:MFS transporter [Cyberlindnera americana]
MSEKDNHVIEVGTITDNNSEIDNERVIKTQEADVSLKLFEQYEDQAGELTSAIESRLKLKIWLRIFPIVFFVNFMLFLDKNAMGYGTLLGLFEDTGLDQASYSNTTTIFYVGYLLGQVPSHYIFQRVRMSYYISGTTLIWSIITLLQLTASSFSGLAAIRFFLGFFESGVTPCLEHTIAMWFTPPEQAIVAPLFWISCIAQGIPGGLVSYGIQFIPNVRPWKVYWGIIGGMSFILSVTSFFFYPDNPATYRFFTPVQRVHVIKRIKKHTNSSIEQKTMKKEQVYEALKDPITWLFAVFVFLNMMCNNIIFQASIIYKNLGFSNLQSTLVSVASSGWSTVSSIAGSICLSIFRSQTAHVGTAFLMVALFGGLLCVCLPIHHSYGILAGVFLTNCSGVAFIATFSWSQSSSAGYTKRLVRTVIWSISYAVSNFIAPQLWRAKNKPRYYPAWIVIIICSFTLSPIILQIIRYILSKRNKERLQYLENIRLGKTFEDRGHIADVDDEGNAIEREVDLSMMDLTDLQNKKFIYPL